MIHRSRKLNKHPHKEQDENNTKSHPNQMLKIYIKTSSRNPRKQWSCIFINKENDVREDFLDFPENNGAAYLSIRRMM